MITYLSLSSMIITATIQASKWLYLKIFLGEDADLLLGCSKMVNQGDRTKSSSQSHGRGKVIQEIFKAVQSRQKFCNDARRRP